MTLPTAAARLTSIADATSRRDRYDREPWDIAAADFPGAGTPADKLAFAVRYAVLAPSSHNGQPWLFHLDGDELELRADRTGALPVVDPEDRELVMSCGAALFTLRIALRAFGLLPEVHALLPTSRHDPLGVRSVPEVLARIAVREGPPPSAAEEALFRAIPRRHTDWSRFAAGSVGAKRPETEPTPRRPLDEIWV